MNRGRVVLLTVGMLAGAYPEGLGAQVPELTVTEIRRVPFDEDAPFARVGRLRRGPDGYLYVMEVGAFGVKGVMVFDQEGHFVRQVGREGDGPGEFRQFGSLGWHGDTLWVLDNLLYRVSEFTLDGEFLGSWRFEPLREGWGESRWDARGILPGHGVVFLERSGNPARMLDTGRLVAADPSGDMAKLIAHWSFAGGFDQVELPGGGGLLWVLPFPTSDLLSIDLDRSRLAVVSRRERDRYVVTMFDMSGDTLYWKEVPVLPQKASQADVKAWRDGLE